MHNSPTHHHHHIKKRKTIMLHIVQTLYKRHEHLLTCRCCPSHLSSTFHGSADSPPACCRYLPRPPCLPRPPRMYLPPRYPRPRRLHIHTYVICHHTQTFFHLNYQTHTLHHAHTSFNPSNNTT